VLRVLRVLAHCVDDCAEAAWTKGPLGPNKLPEVGGATETRGSQSGRGSLSSLCLLGFFAGGIGGASGGGARARGPFLLCGFFC